MGGTVELSSESEGIEVWLVDVVTWYDLLISST